MTEFKTLKEMTTEEKSFLEKELHAGDKAENYKMFRIDKNKSGKICLIKGTEFTDAKVDQIREASNKPNIIDAYVTAYGLGSRKQRKNAESKFSVEAVRVLKRHGK